MSDTPRTDAWLVKLGAVGSTSKFAEHARQLERELNAANAKLNAQHIVHPKVDQT
jgi:hypothetical protein